MREVFEKIVLGACALAAIGFLYVRVAYAEAKGPQDFYTSVAYISDTEGHGSGVFIGSRIVLTARHVVEGVPLDDIRVVNYTGSPYRVVDVKLAEDSDLAVVILAADAEASIAEISCRQPQVMEPLLVVGYPLNLSVVLSKVAVIGFQAGVELDDEHPIAPLALLVSGTVAPGMSGGPVFDQSGKVVATVSGGMNFAVPGPMGLPIPQRSGIEAMAMLSSTSGCATEETK